MQRSAPFKRIWSIFIPILVIVCGLILLSPKPPNSLDHLLPPSSPRTALVLTAHPDDEAMFFAPTIVALISHGVDVRGLCLSTGNSSGLGEVRTTELFGSYGSLGVPSDNVELVDHPALQDSMSDTWDPKVVRSVVTSYLENHPSSLIITFDTAGITNHPNHIALPLALTHLVLPTFPKIYLLRSPSLHSKFTGPLYLMFLILRSHLTPFSLGVTDCVFRFTKRPIPTSWSSLDQPAMFVSSPKEWWTGVGAMLEHRSQLLWFRWLYLAASSLMWVNELEEMA